MRAYRSSLLFIFLALAGSGCSSGDPAIIDQYRVFIGGDARWKQVKTLKSSGEYDYGGIKFPFTAYAKAPDRYKFIVPFNGKYYAQAFDGKKGWKIDAFKNETRPTLLAGDDAKALANESDVELKSPLLERLGPKAIEQGDTTIALNLADSSAGQIIARKVIVKLNASRTDQFYFDVKTGALVMRKFRAKNAELKKAMLTTWYGDYRVISGITVPFKTICEADGQMVLTVTVDKIVIDEPIDDQEFQP